MLLVRNEKEYLILNLLHYILRLNTTKISGYKTGIQFSKCVLLVEQKNYLTKIVNAYIVYDLGDCQKIPLSNLKLKKCLIGATNIEKYRDKSKYVYSGYGVVLDVEGSWNFW